MKKFGIVLLLLVLGVCCGRHSGSVRKSIENGVEVVLNSSEPYRIKGEPSSLNLEKVLVIDFGSDDIGEMGIAGAVDFEVDSEGSIYFFETNNEGDAVSKFDKRGAFVLSFGRRGQGPGEVQYAAWTGIDSRDNIIVSDNGNRKVLVFTKDGRLVRETQFPKDVGLIYPLENGHYFGLWEKYPATAPNSMYMWAFSLYSPDFDEIKLLDTQNVYDFNTQGTRGIHSRPFFMWKRGRGFLYIASEERGYEILVVDGEGSIVRKIRKEYTPVPVTEETIAERKKRFEPYGEKPWFPKYWLPMSGFFVDDEGRIYVRTFERGPNPGEYFFDLFNPDGAFISRKAMNILTLGDTEILAEARGGRLYCFQDKSDGYREFVVYRMTWE
ncbi:MAG: 6-bladed beta-propeller [Candidatus Aminicenantes bacterium]|nr:6-bladed beta-propeller [Candidatus Aminicenantes bacterium]